MKTLLILCAVVSVTFASVMPMEFDFDVFGEDFKSDKGGKDDKEDDFPVTEKQIDCIKDGAYELWEERPDLDEWFTDTEVQAYDLLDRLHDCYDKTGLKRKLCVGKLTVSALAFYYKINKNLDKENKIVLTNLKGVVEDCLDIKLPIV